MGVRSTFGIQRYHAQPSHYYSKSPRRLTIFYAIYLMNACRRRDAFAWQLLVELTFRMTTQSGFSAATGGLHRLSGASHCLHRHQFWSLIQWIH
jgi:hypothetical protein